MSNGLPKIEELKKKPLPEASELKKKEKEEPMESPSVGVSSPSSLESPQDQSKPESIVQKAERYSQDAFGDYVVGAIKNGFITPEALQDKNVDVFKEIATSKITEPTTESKPEDVTWQDASTQFSWGPRIFGTETKPVEQSKEEIIQGIVKSDNDQITEKVKERILNDIPEEDRTPENLEKIEEQLWQEGGIQLDLQGDKRIGEGKGIAGNIIFPLQKGLEDHVMSLYATVNETGVLPEFMSLPPSTVGKAREFRLDELNKKITQYQGDILDNLSDGNFSNAGGLALQQTAESLPLMGAAALSSNPYVAFTALSGLSANKQYQDVKDQDWFKELSDAGKLGYLSIYGAAEGTDLLIGGRILKNAARASAGAGKNAIAGGEFLKDFFKGMGYDIAEEAASEGVTGIVQYVADQAAQGKDITFEGIQDSFVRNAVAGAAGGGIMGAGPRIANTSYNLAAKTPEFLKLKKQEKEAIDDVKNATTPDEVQILSEKVQEIQDAKLRLAKDNKELFDKMSDEDKTSYAQSVTDFNKEQQRLQNIDEKSPAYEIAKGKAEDALVKSQEIIDKYKEQPTETVQETEQVVEDEQQEQVTEKQQDNAIFERKTTEIPSKPETETIQGVEGEVIPERNPTNAIQEVVKSFTEDGTFGQQIESALKPFTKKGGKVTNTQAKTLSKRAAAVKTQDQLTKFVDYASKVLENSEFQAVTQRGKKQRNQARKKYKKGNLGADSGNTLRALRIEPEELSVEDADRYEAMVSRMNSPQYSPVEAQNIEDINYFASKYAPKEPVGKTEAGERATARKKVVSEVFKEEQSKPRDIDVDLTAIQDDIDVMESISDSELDKLSSSEVEKLTTDFVNAKEGFPVSAKTAAVLRKVKKERNAETIKKAIEGKGFKNLIREYFKPTNVTKGKAAKKDRISNTIRNVPLNRIDTIIRGAMDKGKPLYKTLIQPISIAYSKYEGEYKGFEKSLDTIIAKALKSVPRKDRKKVTVKLSLIGLAKQKAMNPDAEELSSVDDYMDAIVTDGKKINNYKDKAELYEEVYNDLKGDDSKLDWEKAYNSLTVNEKIAFQFVENHYAKQADKVAVAAARNGEGTILYDFYNPIRVMFTGKGKELDSLIDNAKDFSKDNVPKSPNLKTRKGSEGQLIYLDFFDNARTSNRSVLRDYYLREQLRDTSGALRAIKEDKDVTGDSRDFVIALEEAMQEVTQNIFINTEFQGNKFLDFLRSRGYERDLVSVPRAAVELVSNVLHASIYDPKSMIAGQEFMSKNNNRDLMDIATKIGTTQFSRLFMGEGTIRSEASDLGTRSINWWDKKMKELSSAFLSKPDAMVAKRLWLGAFTREFKKVSGEYFNVDKFLDEPSYAVKFKDAIKESRDQADFKLSQGFSTMNPFEGIIASQIKKDDNFWKMADKYMTRFVRFEFQSAVDAINGMLGRNEISPLEATQLMAATAMRMAVYQAGLFTLQNTVFGLIEAGLGIEGDREEDDWEKILKRSKMSFLTTGLSLFMLRRMGNLLRIPIVGAVEFLNYKYGEEVGLRDKPEYDSFEDSILYSPAVSAFKIGADYRDWYTSLLDFFSSFAGPLNKLVKSSGRVIQDTYKGGIVDPTNPDEYLLPPSLKSQEAIDRRQNRAQLDALNILSSTAGIPFGRDLVNLYSREVFEEYANKEKKEESGRKRPERPSRSR